MKQQPRGLSLIFFTTLWERFGFGALQAMIVLYMVKALHFGEDRAFLLYGTFASMSFLTPLIGEYFVSRFLGFQKAVMLGGVLLTAGYVLSAFPQLFFLGLSLLIIANGLFSPSLLNISHNLYKTNDTRKEQGMQLIHAGIHIGLFLPPLLIGWFVRQFGWHVGFLIAALSMALSFMLFVIGRFRLRSNGTLPAALSLKAPPKSWLFYPIFFLFIALGVGFFSFLFKFPAQSNLILPLACLPLLAFLILFLMKESPANRSRMIGCIALILIAIGFFALGSQLFTSLILFADKNICKSVFPPELIQFFPPFFLLILCPILARFEWQKDRLKRFASGMIGITMGFFLLAVGGSFFGNRGELSLLWLITSCIALSIGYVLFVPIALDLIKELCPKNFVRMMTGIWLLVQAIGFAIGSQLATLSTPSPQASSTESLTVYTLAFMLYASIGALLSAASFVLIPYFTRISVEQLE